MKPRTVVVQVELETDVSIKNLKDKVKECFGGDHLIYKIEIKRIHVNVIQQTKKTKIRIDY